MTDAPRAVRRPADGRAAALRAEAAARGAPHSRRPPSDRCKRRCLADERPELAVGGAFAASRPRPLPQATWPADEPTPTNLADAVRRCPSARRCSCARRSSWRRPRWGPQGRRNLGDTVRSSDVAACSSSRASSSCSTGRLGRLPDLRGTAYWAASLIVAVALFLPAPSRDSRYRACARDAARATMAIDEAKKIRATVRRAGHDADPHARADRASIWSSPRDIGTRRAAAHSESPVLTD